jgi:hypothetical protein
MSDKKPEWCSKQEALVYKWAERAAGYRWLHNNARIRLKKISNRLTLPSIIISSITGVGGFAVLSPDEPKADKMLMILLLQYFFATLNIISGVLTSVAKFSQSQKLSEAHSLMCIQYAKFYRSIDLELSLDREDRAPVLDFVNKCKDEYDRLLSESPDIPPECIVEFNEEFPQKMNKPDVCNGLSVIDVCKFTPKGKQEVPSQPSLVLSPTIGNLQTRTNKYDDISGRL